MEGNNEKDIRFLAICFVIIQSIIIGFVAFFVIGIAKVDAADYQTLNPSNINTQFINSSGSQTQGKNCLYNELSTCNLSLDNPSGGQRFSMKFSASYYGSASNSISVNYVIGFEYVSSLVNINISENSTIVRYTDNNNNLVKNVSDQCTTTLKKVTQSGFSRLTYFIGNTTCDLINPEGNATILQIYLSSVPEGVPVLTTNQYARISSYTLNRITGTINDSDKLIANNNKNTQWIINNINGGTSQIVSGIDQAKEDIINNQDDNTDRLEDAIKNQNIKCINYNFNNSKLDSIGKLINTGDISNQSTWSYTSDFIPLNKDKTYKLKTINYKVSGTWYCLYDDNKDVIGCYSNNDVYEVNINNNNASYIRYNGQKSNNYQNNFSGEYCYNIIEKGQEDTTNAINDVNDSITDPSIDMSGFSGFNVSGSDGGISSIITAPLSAITGILNSTCSNLVIPIPFVSNKNITLPCLTPIYQQHFPTILNIWQVVVTGIIAYWICLNIFHMVHGFTDPNDDKIEVVDL